MEEPCSTQLACLIPRAQVSTRTANAVSAMILCRWNVCQQDGPWSHKSVEVAGRDIIDAHTGRQPTQAMPVFKDEGVHIGNWLASTLLVSSGMQDLAGLVKELKLLERTTSRGLENQVLTEDQSDMYHLVETLCTITLEMRKREDRHESLLCGNQ